MSRENKTAILVLLVTLLLSLGLLFLASSDTDFFGASEREKLVQAWLQNGYTLAEAERLASEGQSPERENSSVPAPLSLQGPGGSSQIPEAQIGIRIASLYQKTQETEPLSEQGTKALSEQGTEAIDVFCQGVENTTSCLKGASEIEKEGPPDSSLSEIFLETALEVVVVTLRCQGGRVSEPFFSAFTLKENRWEPRYLLAPLSLFEKDAGLLTEQGKDDLLALKATLAASCKIA